MQVFKMNEIIGFAGKMRSGKGVAAHCLEDHYGYAYLEVADKLKEICVKLTGLSDIDELNEYKNNNSSINLKIDETLCKKISELTDVPLDYIREKLLNKHIVNVRVLLQILGTDVLRGYDENWHVYHLLDRITALRKENKPVVIGDIRFPNEKLAIESIGGEVYYVEMTDYDIYNHHPSENSLDTNNFDINHIIYNDIGKNGNLNVFLYNVIEQLKK